MTGLFRRLAIAACGLFLAAGLAEAQMEDRRAEGVLIADHVSVAPGSRVYAALKMTMDEGWHIYWRNAGDAGLPPQLILKEGTTLPDGAVGDFLWPLPHVIPVVEGEIMDYGYDDEVVFAFPVTVPADASGEIRIVAEADYLICESICIPETADVSLSLPVGEPIEDAAGGAEIGQWIARVPAAFGGEARFDDAVTPWTLSLRQPGGFPEGAQIRFFPFGHEISHPAPQHLRAGPEGATLSLTPDQFGQVEETLAGVIRIDAPGAEPVGYEIAATRGEVFAGTADKDIPLAPTSTGAGSSAEAGDPAALGWERIATLAFFAFIGGLILNLMPCVLPVLSMKAIGMVQAAATGHAGELKSHGVWYTAGVLVSFLALGTALLAVRQATGFATLGFQLQHAPTVAVLALVMFAVGLWLMGFFELGMSVQNLGGGLAAKSGAAGAFFTGVLAAVVGAPCVGPFLGAALGAVISQPAPAVIAVFLAMGFGMALPFLVLSFVPGLHRLLPKPGKWMDTLKQAFAFPMFLTAAWLLSVVAGLAGAGAAGWTLAGATALVFAVWLGRQGGAVRRGLAIVALGAAFIYPAVQANVPEAAISGSSQAAFTGTYGEAAWSPETVVEKLAEGRPVFVDFTASWCASCQVNKLTTLKTRKVQEAFTNADVAFLVADFTQKDPLISEELKLRGRAGVPMYLWYPAGASEPQILPELLTQELVIGLVEG
ncbi:thioredoxin family protein [Hyphomonas sp. WL0036]|uniref:protein-disulfide reductase DsbD family protein n=1 Tax=Hyphomonas sediminis TaxID=2866160 RepID=UPI001C7FA371|nr:protein-disulfide reductase DsbD domain-containing protein [Hyphomonas sediminis]MBY9066406.1 thioredoxin family protein [Hyphomonas sediminis]